MNNALDRNPYCAAFAEASSELERIIGEIEELRLRRARIEKAVAVLKCQIDVDHPVQSRTAAQPTIPVNPGAVSAQPTVLWKRVLMPGLTIETRVRFDDSDEDYSN